MHDVVLRGGVFFLQELGHRQVVVGLVVPWVQLDCLFVVYHCFFGDAEAEVGVGEVLVEIVFSPVLEAFLQDDYAFRVPSEEVECGCAIVVEVEGELELFGGVF